MAGQFDRTVLPALAGSYFNWEADAEETPVIGLGGIVAIVGTHDWGPINSAELYTSPRDFVLKAGPTFTSTAKRVYDAFRGEGTPGKGGASAVLVVRAATSAAAFASLILLNTSGNTGITLTARFKGTFANGLRVTLQPGVASGTEDLIVTANGRLISTLTYTANDLAGLVDELNASSDYFTAVVGAAPTVPLAAVANAQVANGNDGAILTATEHAASQALLNNSRFSVMSPVSLTDGAIRTSYVAWNQEQNALGKRFFLVVGGATNETLPTANSRSRAFNAENVVNLGVASLYDDARAEVVSTADLTARVAGAVAARGERRDLIYARFAGLSVPQTSVLPSLGEQESARDAGTTVFSRDTNRTPVFIREGITTYSDDSASPVDSDGFKTKPLYMYRRIKNLRIQHGIEMAVDEWATSGDVLGELPNNERARALIIGRFKLEYATRETAEIVQPGWSVVLDPSIEQDDDDDFAAFLHGFHPTRSLRLMLNTVRMG